MRGSSSTFDPARTYAFLEDGGGAVVLPGGAEFWNALAAGPPFPGDVERVVSGSGWLPAARAFVVPRGAWHRQVVRVPGTCVGVTFGRGSEHRPLGEAAARRGRRASAGKRSPAPGRRTARR